MKEKESDLFGREQYETDSFGSLLRKYRKEANIGVREMARLVDIAPGYLGDIESGRRKPPPEAKIIEISRVLGGYRDELLAAAQKGDPEISDYFASQPKAAEFFRKHRNFDEDDWKRLDQLAQIANLGKDKDTK
jgi:transcriptional regulator with XRE-family HTH domain